MLFSHCCCRCGRFFRCFYYYVVNVVVFVFFHVWPLLISPFIVWPILNLFSLSIVIHPGWYQSLLFIVTGPRLTRPGLTHDLIET